MGFDINRGKEVKEREDKSIVLPVKNELGEVQEGAEFDIVGSYSKTYADNAEAYRKKNKEEGRDPSHEELSAAVGAFGIRGWRGITSNGEAFPFSTENAIAILIACPWIDDDVRRKVYDHAAFFPKPSPASSAQ